MKNYLIIFLILLLAGCGGEKRSLQLPEEEIGRGVGDLSPGETEVYNFEDDLVPIFEKHCSKCHGPSQTYIPYWGDYDVASSKIDRINNRLFIVKDMPMDNPGGVVGMEAKLIQAWIKQGGPKVFNYTKAFLE